MSLTVYDQRLGCHVLAPIKTEIINAFHPDYMKTYHPDFMKDFRSVEGNRIVANEQDALKPKEFHTFQKAGNPKPKRKK